MNRTTLALAAAVAAALTAAAPAAATDVSRFETNPEFVRFGATDILNANDKLTIAMETKGYVDFADSVPLTTAAKGCVVLQGGAHVECNGSGVDDLQASAALGGGNDSALVLPPPAGFAYYVVTLSGGAGSDTLESRGPAVTMFAGEGTDRLIPGPGHDDLYGDGGEDTVDYSGRTAPVTVDLGTDQPVNGVVGEKDRIKTVEDVTGGAGADKLTGNDDGNAIFAGPGKDTVSGRGGNDEIEARDGSKDTIACGAGNDTVNADHVDVVAADCETVKRGGAPAGPGVVGQPPVDPPPPPIDPPADPGNPSDPGHPSNPGHPVADTTAPKLSKVAFSPRTFRAAKGSRLRLTLSEASTLAVRVERLSRGRRSGKTCGRETAKLRHRHAKPCTRAHRVTTRKAAGLPSGTRRIAFSGKVKKHALPAGSYRATVVATDAAGNASKRVAVRFYVAKPKHRS